MQFFRKKTDWDGSERRNRDRVAHLRMNNPLKIFRISNLRKRLLIYFILIIFVTLSVGAQLIFEAGSKRLVAQISDAVTLENAAGEPVSPDMAAVTQVLKNLQYRMILVMTIVFICILATMFVFIRNIVEPLDAIGKSAKLITEGHLDETVPVRCNDEIGQIGELINDLAINLQEVLLHVWNHTCQDIRLMDNIAEIIHSQPDEIMPEGIREQFDFVRRDIEEMQEIVKAFDYYNIRFEGDRLVGNEDETALPATDIPDASNNAVAVPIEGTATPSPEKTEIPRAGETKPVCDIHGE